MLCFLFFILAHEVHHFLRHYILLVAWLRPKASRGILVALAEFALLAHRWQRILLRSVLHTYVSTEVRSNPL